MLNSKPSHDGDPSQKTVNSARSSKAPHPEPPLKGTIHQFLRPPSCRGGGRSNGHRNEPTSSRQHLATRSHATSRSRSCESTGTQRKPRNQNSFLALLDNEADTDLEEDKILKAAELLCGYEGLTELSDTDSIPSESPFVKPTTLPCSLTTNLLTERPLWWSTRDPRLYHLTSRMQT
jgi:hypothetical protein